MWGPSPVRTLADPIIFSPTASNGWINLSSFSHVLRCGVRACGVSTHLIFYLITLYILCQLLFILHLSYTRENMSTISIADVQKLAQLSALTITDDQVTTMTDELNEILGYVEQLNEVDTEGVEPTYQVNGLENVTRPDEIVDMGVSQADLLKNAPAEQDGSIKVPRVLE